MKVFLSLIVSLLSISASAWNTRLTCNDGRALLQQNGFQHQYQLVIIDDNIIEYFLRERAVQPFRIKYEYHTRSMVIPLGPITMSPDLIGQEDAFRTDGQVFYVKLIGQGLKVESFRTTTPTGGIFNQHEERASWFFRSCVK